MTTTTAVRTSKQIENEIFNLEMYLEIRTQEGPDFDQEDQDMYTQRLNDMYAQLCAAERLECV